MNTSQSVSSGTRWKAAGLLAPGFLLLTAAPALAHRLEQHFTVDPRPVITIHNPNGKVIVRAWAKPEVMVVANHASAKVEVNAEQSGNRVDIMTRQLEDTISPDDLRADYEINVPEDAELQIHNDSGEVNVANVLGDMNVETVAAGVDLEDAAGYLTVKTVGGSFQCLRCAGRLEVSSISGALRLLSLRSYHVRAQTATGNILFDGEFLPNGLYRLKNYSGAIEVRFSPGDSFDLTATSLKGRVNNQAKLTPPTHPPHYLSKFSNTILGTLNAGRAKVELSSFDGTINVLKRD
ncbi:MAG TPA: DUF4097 family beta strand repeat-containing protein [Candidatus Sulfotelmatobacter sp.]|nr:DUF4097 family beta strand repeat-containing protein [Candidatus Sulfotelmatobacter sp.]